MRLQQVIRGAVAGALLLSTAALAVPWPAWLNARLMNGKTFGYYYYGTAYTNLYSFKQPVLDPHGGAYPLAGLTNGGDRLFGTTSKPGTAFSLFPLTNPDADWGERVIAQLQGPNTSRLTAIDSEQLAGTEENDVFILTFSGSSITKRVIYTFDGGSNASPASSVTAGPYGELYGTAKGGPSGHGFVYKLTPNEDGQYTESTLLQFHGGMNGSEPSGGVVFGANGLLYGSTRFGGSGNCQLDKLPGCGVVYSVSATGVEHVLHRFTGSDGAGPGELTLDGHGSIVGATNGTTGTVFHLSPSPSGSFVFSTIYSFQGGADGYTPNTKVVVDTDGAIYGTAQGGVSGLGTVFVLVPPIVPGRQWNLTVLHSFTGDAKTADGAHPAGGLLIDLSGALYGVTTYGGAYGGGSVYRIMP